MSKLIVEDVKAPCLTFPIHETFQQSIQGEGFWSGTPCDFIRLYGCPVGCWFCDTGYSSKETGKPPTKTFKTIEDLIGELRSEHIVISGGEPFIHKELPELVEALNGADKFVAIETSGSFFQPVNDAWITLSPKEHLNNRYPVLNELWGMANEIKIVISKGDEVDFYRSKLEDLNIPIYLQPEWNYKKGTLPLTLELVKEHGYRLSLQTHKIIGVQ
jgi:organic radical activating enzyme